MIAFPSHAGSAVRQNDVKAQIMILLDTDVMVDLMRGYEPAIAWLDSLGAEAIGIPGLVAMELFQGCRDRVEQQQVERALRAHALYWPTERDCTRALDSFMEYHLSHGIGVLDALVAETAVGLRFQLATFNDRHYRVIGALETIHPYARQGRQR
jgi:predicted nucleic acid-binding protein